MSTPAVARCAIYTRKSSEEGLEQEFNSLEAQRDACAAYIKSQTHQGWRLVPEHFDDGGHSGGTLERPALKRLLELVRARRVDVIVIYKIDRLTRSLADFARLAELFDAHSASFVSVTQQFNTTTSMGRLMLNVLLSFAQFEREITGERIRDKIAASKKKGMWMGGFVPLGYDALDRSLVINQAEAETVRTLFQLYVRKGNVRQVQVEATQLGLKTKRRHKADGSTSGGEAFRRGHLYQVLNNPIYAGQIAHKERVYPGTHPPIVDRQTWDAVQHKLATNMNGHRSRANASSRSLLAGLLFDDRGSRFTPSHATKRGKRYRYYVQNVPIDESSSAGRRRQRIPATEIENAVRDAIVGFLGSPDRLAQEIGMKGRGAPQIDLVKTGKRLSDSLIAASPEQWTSQWRPAMKRVVLHEESISISLHRDNVRCLFGLPETNKGSNPECYEIQIPLHAVRRGSELRLVVGDGDRRVSSAPDPTLIKALARAHGWFDRLRTGAMTSIPEIARTEKLTRPYVARVLRLAFLAPDIVTSISVGTQPIEITAERISRNRKLAHDWIRQRAQLACELQTDSADDKKHFHD